LPNGAGGTTPVADPGNLMRGLAVQPLGDNPAVYAMSTDDQALFARGSYLVNAVVGCNDCHGWPARVTTPGSTFLMLSTDDYLAGGRVFGVPPTLQAPLNQVYTMSANLIGPANGALHAAPPLAYPFFIGLLETGAHVEDPDQRLVGFPMPVQVFRQMTNYDLQALYTYLNNVKTPSTYHDKATQPPTRHCAADGDCKGTGEKCNTATSECYNGGCSTSSDCGACQSCTIPSGSTTGTCTPPSGTSCTGGGI
jgi:hypothetical protein